MMQLVYVAQSYHAKYINAIFALPPRPIAILYIIFGLVVNLVFVTHVRRHVA